VLDDLVSKGRVRDVQVGGLHAQLDVVPGEDLSALRAANALHRAFLGAPTDSNGADCALVFEELGSDGAC
jgi:hypothetical protein